MIETFLYKNLAEWLKKDIEFNDLIRCVIDEDEDDITQRYQDGDTFSKHFDDRAFNQSTNTNFLYPFVGVDFGPYNANVRFHCGVDINVTFTVELGNCSPETCSLTSEGCSIPISDPRFHVGKIIDKAIKLFGYQVIDENGVITRTDIFRQLRGSEYEIFDCDTEEYTTLDWDWNVWAELAGEPIISEMQVNNSIYQKSVTIPLNVQRISNDAEGIDCSYCY